MKKFYFILSLLLVLPKVASAHVKWFVDSQSVIENGHGMSAFYGWGSKEVLIWSGVVFAVVFIFSRLDKALKTPKGLLSFGLKHEKGINRIAQVVLGVFLITVSLVWKVILIPEFPINSFLTNILGYIEVLFGLMFIFNIKPRVASLGLGVLCLGLIAQVGFVAFLENALLFSLAVYFFVVNSKESSKAFRLHKHAVEIVRIATGVSLVTLAFTEKLLYPELSMNFLEVHHWNFMQSVFPWFSDKLFVLSTGFAEMIFGILFILGYITRITTVLIAIFFGFSVTTMLMQFGEWEVEDLVVYVAAVLFVFYGHGRTKFFHFTRPKTNPLVANSSNRS